MVPRNSEWERSHNRSSIEIEKRQMKRCQKLLEAALDQPSPTPELAEAIRAFVKPKPKPKPKLPRWLSKPRPPAAPKPDARKTERRIITILNPNHEICKQKISPAHPWCREPAAYYGQWKQKARNGRIVFFSHPLCKMHGREYAREYDLEIIQVCTNGEA